MKVHVTILYSTHSKKDASYANQEYAFDWTGKDMDQLFRKVAEFDSMHKKATSKYGKLL